MQFLLFIKKIQAKIKSKIDLLLNGRTVNFQTIDAALHQLGTFSMYFISQSKNLSTTDKAIYKVLHLNAVASLIFQLIHIIQNRSNVLMVVNSGESLSHDLIIFFKYLSSAFMFLQTFYMEFIFVMVVLKQETFRKLYFWMESQHKTDSQSIPWSKDGLNQSCKLSFFVSQALKFIVRSFFLVVMIIIPAIRFLLSHDLVDFIPLTYRVPQLNCDTALEIFVNYIHQVILVPIQIENFFLIPTLSFMILMHNLTAVDNLSEFIKQRDLNDTLTNELHQKWIKTIVDSTQEISE